MEYGLLFKKTSTCYKNPDIEYLDETSDYKLKIYVKQGNITEEEFREKHAELEKNISYLTKDNHGRVYAGGFLRDALLVKKGIAPEKWDNEVRKKAITAAVFKATRRFGSYRGTIGHKMVFSVSEELFRKIEDSGLNLDEVLGREVKKIMYEFQRKFHPGEKIGFAWGIHHDTDNRHVHVYLCNRTDQGNHIALSNPLKGRAHERTRKNQIGYMKERCIAAQKRMIKAAEQMSRSQLPKKVALLKVEHKKPYQMSEKLMEKERQLEQMRRSVISKKNQLQLKRIAIRQYSSQYYLQKEFIARGWQDVKAINRSISEDFKEVKKNDSFISPKLLRELGYVSDSGTIKFFSKMLFMMHNQQNVFKRQALFEQINKSKQYKLHLLEQLKLLDQQQRVFYRNLREMKEQRNRIKEEFYESYNSYERQKEKFNAEFFREVIDDPQKINEYKRTIETVWSKRKNGEDCSEQLKTLQRLNSEARSKVEPPKKPEKINQNQLLLNYGLFCKQIKDESRWLEYQETVRQLLRKEKREEDYSLELAMLDKLDKEAKDIFTGVKKIPEVTQQEIETEEVVKKEEKPLEFDWEETSRNYDFFCQWVENRELQQEYWDTRMLIADKKRQREDYSLELKYLRKLDEKAQKIANQSSQNIKPPVIEEVIPKEQDAEEKPLTFDREQALENYEFFCDWVEDKKKQNDYWDARKRIIDKMSKNEDFSSDLKFLHKCDKEAEEMAAGKKEPEILEENKQETWKNKWSLEEVEAIEKEIKRVKESLKEQPALLKLSRWERDEFIQRAVEDLKLNGIKIIRLDSFQEGRNDDSEKNDKGWKI